MGLLGTVVDIIYQNNHQPPVLPIAVKVEFENYRGPVFNEDPPLCVLIYPIIVTSQTEIDFHERQHEEIMKCVYLACYVHPCVMYFTVALSRHHYSMLVCCMHVLMYIINLLYCTDKK